MKRIWIQRIGAAVLCAVLLAGCMPGGPAADSTASADPLTGQEQQYPGQRPAAVVIDNAPGSTTQWGIGSASVVLEAAARDDTAGRHPLQGCFVLQKKYRHPVLSVLSRTSER